MISSRLVRASSSRLNRVDTPAERNRTDIRLRTPGLRTCFRLQVALIQDWFKTFSPRTPRRHEFRPHRFNDLRNQERSPFRTTSVFRPLESYKTT
jgi:hypothetical protein